MATNFIDIYSLNSIIKSDNRINIQPLNLIYQLYYQYLCFAISYFADDCYKNLNDIIEFQQQEYEFTGDGVNNKFVLDTEPPINCNFYISINSSTDYSYSYNKSTLEITLTPTPAKDSEIYIAGYIEGQFNDSLNIKEKVILAKAMNIPWLEQKRNKEELLRQSILTNDYKRSSQAEHIHQLNLSIEQNWKDVKSLINDYSFKQNPNNLLGLGGDLI